MGQSLVPDDQITGLAPNALDFTAVAASISPNFVAADDLINIAESGAVVLITGKVVGKPPFTGSLGHRGWRVTDTRLPKLAEGHDASVIAQAELEL